MSPLTKNIRAAVVALAKLRGEVHEYDSGSRSRTRKAAMHRLGLKLARAKAEGWDLTDEQRADLATVVKRTPTRRQELRRAVDLDAHHVRRWIDGSWTFVFVNVRISDFPDGVTPLPEDLDDYGVLCGVEYGTTGYGEAPEDDTVQTLGDELIEAHLARQRAASVSEVARRDAVARARGALKPVTVQELGLYLDIPDDAAVRDDGWVQAWVAVHVPDTGDAT